MYSVGMVLMLALYFLFCTSWSRSSDEGLLEDVLDGGRHTIVDWFSLRTFDSSISQQSVGSGQTVMETNVTSMMKASTILTPAANFPMTGGGVTTALTTFKSRQISSNFSLFIIPNPSASAGLNTSATTRNATVRASPTLTTFNNSTTPSETNAGKCSTSDGSDFIPLLAICLPIVGVFLAISFVIAGRQYRRFVGESQEDHRRNWREKVALKEVSGFNKSHLRVREEDVDEQSLEAEPHMELFLPDDVQRVVDRIEEMRQQPIRVSVNRYGTIVRKPLGGC